MADAHTAAYARATLEAQLAQAREDGYSVGEEGRAGAEEEVEPGATLPCPRCNGEAQGASCAACGLSLVLAGRYQLRRVVGFGSSGGVYEATDPEGRLVAVKLLRLGTHIDRQARTHFIRGAEVLRQLEHPLLPRVEAFEEDEIGSLVLVREYFAGGSLHERVTERSWRLEGGELRRLTERLLELLGYLHGRVPPVIHRDIKPRNLLCRNASGRLGPDEPVLVDFDSVAATGETTGETIVVSAGYTAPEQLAGAATPASDLYSLGATLLFLATHVEPDELPRDADGRLQIGERLDHLEAPLRGVLLRLVEPDRRQRFQRAQDALEALRSGSAQAPARADGAAARPGTLLGRAWPLLAGLVAVGMVVAGLVLRPEPPPPPGPYAKATCRAVFTSGLKKSDPSGLKKSDPID
ncbi:MAG TPA: serine/threonine-protein kinase, partial [Myxococcota bacterium]|nr:serine/threonine-protein kinase [Myxococcota bacterium]